MNIYIYKIRNGYIYIYIYLLLFGSWVENKSYSRNSWLPKAYCASKLKVGKAWPSIWF